MQFINFAKRPFYRVRRNIRIIKRDIRVAFQNFFLFQAIRKNDLDGAKMVVQAGAQVNKSFSPFSLFCFAIDVYTLQRLKWTKYFSASPLHYAVELKSLEMVEFLLKNGAYGDKRDRYHGETPLHCAVRLDFLEVVKGLIERGAVLDAKSYNNNTPLHYAAFLGHLDVMKILIECGAALDAKNKNDRTPLHYAALLGRLDVMKVLIDCGAKSNVKNFYGATPLHEAVKHGRSECIKALLQAGADVNVKNSQKETPMHVACRRERKSEYDIKILLSYHPNLKLKDKYGISVFDFVKKDKSFLRVCFRLPVVLVGCMQDLLMGNNPSFLSNRQRWFPSAAKAVEDFRQDKKGPAVFYQGKRKGQSSNIVKLPSDMVREILRFSKPSYMSTQKWEKDISKAEELCLGGKQVQRVKNKKA